MSKTRLVAPVIAFVSALAGNAAAQSTQSPPKVQPARLQMDPSQPPPAAPAQPAPTPVPGQPSPLAPSPLEGQPPAPVDPAPVETAPYEPPPPAPVYDVPPPLEERSHDRAGHFGLGVTWNIGFPLGSVADFTGKVSGVGFELFGKYWVGSQVTLGLDVDWQTYVHSRPRTTYQIPNGAVTATAYNALQTGAIRAGGDFYFLDEGVALPFIGANIGYGWSTFQTDIADIQLYDNEDSVILGAELGLALAFSHNSPLVLVFGRYSVQPAAEFLNTVNDIQAITIQIGLMSR